MSRVSSEHSSSSLPPGRTQNPLSEEPLNMVVDMEALDALEKKFEAEDPGSMERFEEDEPEPVYSISIFDKLNVSKKHFKYAGIVTLIGYSIAAFSLDFDRAQTLFYIELALVLIGLLSLLATRFSDKIDEVGEKIRNTPKLWSRIALLLMFIAMLSTAIALSADNPERLTALGGLGLLILLSYAFSWKRSAINWRPVIWGFTLQYIFALLILKTTVGQDTFQYLGNELKRFLDFTNKGTEFCFGYLVQDIFVGGQLLRSVFVFKILTVIVFFSSVVSVLYYLNIIQPLTRAFGRVMQYTLGTSAPESLSAAGNIFLGQTESPLMIRPYLKYMTNSELHAVMTGGFATIAGGVLAAFIGFGVPPEHLLAASVMSAPAALAISKIVYPEDIKVDDSNVHKIELEEKAGNVIEAAVNGATASIYLIANITVMLIAFLAILAFLNKATFSVLSLVDIELTFQDLLAYLFYPFAIIMGVDADDALDVGQLLGTKVFVNEFVAFLDLQFASGLDPTGRSYLIATYALCGFSNFSSIGIQLAALGAMAPSKKTALSKMALSAMISGNIACFMTACIAGVLL